MKKSLYMITILLMLSLSAFWTLYTKFTDSQAWNTVENSRSTETFYIHQNEQFDRKNFFESINELTTRHPISIVKTDHQLKGETPYLIKAVLSGEEDSSIYQLSLLSGRFISAEESEKVLTTEKQAGDEASGILFDLFADDHVEIWTMEKYVAEIGNMSGEYKIVSNETLDTEKIIVELAEKIGVPTVDLLQQRVFSEAIMPLVTWVCLGFSIILFSLYMLFLIFYTLKRSKKICVQKIQGWSNLNIWWYLIDSIVYSAVIGMIGYNIIFITIARQFTRSFFLELIFLQAALVIGLVIASCIIFFFLIKLTIKDSIKNKLNLKLPLYLTYIFRCCFIFLTLLSLNYLVKAAQETVKLSRDLVSWGEVGDYQILTSTEVGLDMASYTQGDPKLFDDGIDYWESINRLGAFFMTSTILTPFEQLVSDEVKEYIDIERITKDYKLPILRLNRHYYQEISPQIELMEELTLSEDEEALVILIPQSKSSEEDLIITIMKAIKIDEEASYYRFRNESMAAELLNEEIEVKTIIYADRDFFSFSPDVAEKTNFRLASPIISILTEKNQPLGTGMETLVSGLTSGVKLPADWTKEQLEPMMKDHELDDNNLIYEPISSYFAAEIKNMHQVALSLFLAVSFLFILNVVVIAYLLIMTIQIKKQRLVIQKLMGMGLFKRYKLFYILPMLTYTLSSIGITIVGGYDGYFILAVLLTVGLDSFLSALAINKKESQSLVTLIKGET